MCEIAPFAAVLAYICKYPAPFAVDWGGWLKRTEESLKQSHMDSRRSNKSLQSRPPTASAEFGVRLQAMHKPASISVRCEGTLVFVRAEGAASSNARDFPIYAALKKALADAIREETQAIVFDFRRLKYEYGDNMAELLGRWGVPFAVVVSPINVEGLTSLVRSELPPEDPESVLFPTLQEAIAGVQAQLGHTGAT